jgi:hypothetical protein
MPPYKYLAAHAVLSYLLSLGQSSLAARKDR